MFGQVWGLILLAILSMALVVSLVEFHHRPTRRREAK